jgi:hypothetical protein
LIQGKPVVGNFQVESAVADGCLLEPLLESFLTSGRDVILDGALDKAAALARPGKAVNGSNGVFLQDDIDPFQLVLRLLDVASTLYTHRVGILARAKVFTSEP